MQLFDDTFYKYFQALGNQVIGVHILCFITFQVESTTELVAKTFFLKIQKKSVILQKVCKAETCFF
jgi:hypothetical protein